MKPIFPAGLALLVLSTIATFGQKGSDPSSAAIAWTQYRIASPRVAMSFPKLPVKRETADYCAQTKGEVYHAYAAGAVYEFEWHARSGKRIPDRCSTKEEFSHATFINRVSDVKSANKDSRESETMVAGNAATVIRWESPTGVIKTRWLVWEKDRWFELAITRRRETVVDEERFTNGLKLSGSGGIKLKQGANVTFGDAGVDLESDAGTADAKGLVIVTKPRPGYTEAARASNVQGTVLLRLTFYRNGGVGGISVVKALPLGLTEQSIAAAKKIAFLPASSDGKPRNIVRQIEYTFSIY